MILPTPAEIAIRRQYWLEKKQQEKLEKDAEQTLKYLYNIIVNGKRYFYISNRKLENPLIKEELVNSGWLIKQQPIKFWEKILYIILQCYIVNKFEIIAGRE